MDDDVGAELDRPLQRRRQEGVVDDDERADRVRGLRDRGEMSVMRSSGLDGVSIQTSCGRSRERFGERARIGEVGEVELEQRPSRPAR